MRPSRLECWTLRPLVIGGLPGRALVVFLYALTLWLLLNITACSPPPSPTPGATSPDGRFRAELRELDRFIDRNFEVVVIDQQAMPRTPRVIFTSPDEGAPPGTERFVWSKDSRAVLLVGRHFFTGDDDARIAGQEQPYLLYDVVTEALWCNTAQVSDLERIDSALLAKYGLADWDAQD